ncbi:MAG: hypothetical protein ABIU05_11125 [Nitrospirales bacterium]
MSVQSNLVTLNAAVLFGVACAACKRLQTADRTSINCDALVSIVFSAATIESFLNELPRFLSMFRDLLQDEPPQVPLFVKQANELINKRGRAGSTENKYLLAYSILSKRDCEKGGPDYQNFKLLFEARNGLMHAKSATFSGEADPDGNLVLGVSDKLIEKFGASGFLNELDAPLPGSLRIATPKAAHWACNTAAAVVNSIVNVVPECQHKHNLLKYCDGFKPISTA